jgi:16S rRNA (cytosine967-C5)-methyltransferase
MTPPARVQAAIEILDLVIDAARSGGAPADRIVTEWFRTRRFAGSKDRRAVRELVYRAIRACGDVPESGRAAMLRVAADDAALGPLFDGSLHGPQPVTSSEPVASGAVAPAWLEQRLAASGVTGDEARAMLERAPLDVRINALKASAAPLPEGGEQIGIEGALRYPHGARIEDSEAFLLGAIEVQDAGSQLACRAVQAGEGARLVDLCAGAGGKALALAARVGDTGKVLACDTDRSRLSRLTPRAQRAGAAAIIETRLLDPGREIAALADWQGRADAVLVDAPCSGTGTWRRNPEARWRLSPKWLAGVTTLQARLLDLAAGLVRPGGALVYVTCSLLDEEGADQAKAFLARHDGWQAEPLALGAGEPRGQGLRLSPFRDGTDGFFIARLIRLC